MRFFSELKRRKVYRAAALYVIVSWVVLQVADVFMSLLPLPDWFPNLVFVLLVLGFPVALVLAWAFELTPEGIRPESRSDPDARPGSSLRWTDGLIIAGLGAIILYTLLPRWGSNGQEPGNAASGEAAPASIDSIVVLPLADLSSDPSQAYFAAGMHEALITELSKVEALRVISRTSAMAYAGSDKPLPEIARDLGVDAVVEGSVLRLDDTVRVTAQLIEARTDRHLWAENYDRPLTDILSLYGEVAREIVEQIRVKMTPEESSLLANDRTVDPEVYERYLKGRYLCQNWSPQEMAQGIELMREAARMDPTYAPAQAELALCLQYSAFFNFSQPLEVFDESLAAAKRAVELDEKLAEAHVALAGVRYYLDYDREASERQLERALELNPGSVKALIHLSWLLGESGRFDEAIAVTRKAIEFDPLNTNAAHALGQVHYLARNYQQAIEAYGAALEMDPGDPTLIFSLSMALWEAGQQDLALRYSRSAVEVSGRAGLFVSALGYQLALAGREAEARRLLEELMTETDNGAYDIAVLHIGLGEFEKALDYLEQAYRQRNSQIVYLPHGPAFDPLRRHPRFRALMDRLGWSGRLTSQ